jgi:serine/threonine protein kinase
VSEEKDHADFYVKHFTTERGDGARLECQMLCKLRGSKIAPQCYGVVNESQGGFALVMEDISGTPLDECIDMLPKVAAAIQTLHQHGVVHNDLKPEHLLIQTDGCVRVIDFDLATPTPFVPLKFVSIFTKKVSTPNPRHSGDFQGSARYASINAHIGQPTRPASDFESLYYIALYLYGHALQWSGLKKEGSDLADVLVDIGSRKIRAALQNPLLFELVTSPRSAPHDTFIKLLDTLHKIQQEARLSTDSAVAVRNLARNEDKPDSPDLEQRIASAPIAPSDKKAIGAAQDQGGRKGEVVVCELLNTALETDLVKNRAKKDCPPVKETDFVFPFRNKQCETDIYFKWTEDPKQSIPITLANNNDTFTVLTLLDNVNVEHKCTSTLVVGEIGTSLQVGSFSRTSALCKRNQLASAVMRELGSGHPLEILQHVGLALLVVGVADTVVDTLEELTAVMKRDLIFFPVDYVLAAAGRLLVVRVQHKKLGDVVWEAETIISLHSGHSQGRM